MDIIDKVAETYHVKYGKENSQIMTIGKHTDKQSFRMGEITLHHTEKYKYLG